MVEMTCKMRRQKQWRLSYSWKFFPTARALLGYFEVTWHLIMKLSPAKISEWATLQNLWRQGENSALLPAIVIFLDFLSTKQGLSLVDSWSRDLD